MVVEILIFVIFVASAISCYAADEEKEYSLNGQICKEIYETDLINYIKKKDCWYEGTDQKAVEVYYKNGKADGVARTWYENGQLHQEFPYKLGTMSGTFREWFENGQQKSEELYENGNMEKRLTWYENGQLNSIVFYKDGKVNGVMWRYENMERGWAITI